MRSVILTLICVPGALVVLGLIDGITRAWAYHVLMRKNREDK